jgi:hypothetical protein
VVETVLGGVRLLADILLLLAIGDSGSLLGKTLLLLSLGLGTVLVEDLERLSSQISVRYVLELSDGRRDLQAHVEAEKGLVHSYSCKENYLHLLLALKTHVRGPSDHTADVALGLDVLTDAIVAGTLLDEGVLSMLELVTKRGTR